jgi:hypothetical protein
MKVNLHNILLPEFQPGLNQLNDKMKKRHLASAKSLKVSTMVSNSRNVYMIYIIYS